MRKTQRIFALLLAVMMVVAMMPMAFAANNITVNGKTGHEYEAYQIFSGAVVEDPVPEGAPAGTEPVKHLGSVEWGKGIKAADFLAALKDDANLGKTFKDCDTAASVAEALGTIATDPEKAKLFAKIAGQHLATASALTGVADGYYLIKDQNDVGGNDVLTSNILQVVSDVTVTPKGDVPTVEKKVKDINDSTESAEGKWQDSADHDVGDIVTFKLTATLPDNYVDYNRYKLVFHDDMSAGLAFEAISSVTLGEGGTAITAYDLVKSATDGHTFDVVIPNLKTAAPAATNSSTVVVIYTATVTNTAVIGAEGNPNTVKLEYSNNPNYNGNGDEPTGETPEDTVIVFTYELDVNKTDASGAALNGATFALYKKYAVAQAGTPYNSTSFDSSVTSAHSADFAKYDGQNYYLVEELDGEAASKFTFKRIDDGEYLLVETGVPTGFNGIVPIEITVTATHDEEAEEPTLTGFEVTTSEDVAAAEGVDQKLLFNATLSTGIADGSIKNQSGAVLPSTGGIGTTIFYVGGGFLVVAAGILLITKRRMGAEK